mmetsp:Transcript_1197/g.3402  ORF Transcript_1197/g.3402 Transcript_1197/m.3402 type:complete len:263 (+) Transcript_1197:670-1458(+)
MSRSFLNSASKSGHGGRAKYAAERVLTRALRKNSCLAASWLPKNLSARPRKSWPCSVTLFGTATTPPKFIRLCAATAMPLMMFAILCPAPSVCSATNRRGACAPCNLQTPRLQKGDLATAADAAMTGGPDGAAVDADAPAASESMVARPSSPPVLASAALMVARPPSHSKRRASSPPALASAAALAAMEVGTVVLAADNVGATVPTLSADAVGSTSLRLNVPCCVGTPGLVVLVPVRGSRRATTAGGAVVGASTSRGASVLM